MKAKRLHGQVALLKCMRQSVRKLSIEGDIKGSRPEEGQVVDGMFA